MELDRKHILKEIERTAEENNGVPLGRTRFEKETGIKAWDWGKYWAKFSDAQIEAGFKPNTLTSAYEPEFILEKYISLIEELERFPTTADIRVKSHNDPDFPSKNTMGRFGNKRETAKKVLEFAKQQGNNEVIQICENVIVNYKPRKSVETKESNIDVGEVYLFKSGRYYKIGKTNDTVRRGNEIRIQLPEKLDLIHSIKTDDTSGVEAYWHRRFNDKRKQGEWFDLSTGDIKAFKRWRKIF
jgi:hypothetical protein